MQTSHYYCVKQIVPLGPVVAPQKYIHPAQADMQFNYQAIWLLQLESSCWYITEGQIAANQFPQQSAPLLDSWKSYKSSHFCLEKNLEKKIRSNSYKREWDNKKIMCYYLLCLFLHVDHFLLKYSLINSQIQFVTNSQKLYGNLCSCLLSWW